MNTLADVMLLLIAMQIGFLLGVYLMMWRSVKQLKKKDAERKS